MKTYTCNRGLPKRLKTTTSTLAIAISMATTAVHAAGDRQFFDIQTDQLGEALKAFAVQTDSEIVFTSDLVREKYTQGLKGQYNKTEALERILAGTGLTVETADNNVLLVKNTAETRTAREPEPIGKKKVATDSDSPNAPVESSRTETKVYEELVVTATKRDTTVLETPLAISALSGNLLEKRGIVGMSDYLSSIPGVTMQDRGAGQNNIVIRGIASNPQTADSTAGVYLGETPITDLGSATNASQAGSADIKLVDIERVEVLRGPQGTLYGAGSLGGTVRVIPNSPDLQQVEGSVSARYSQTGERGGDNTMLQGVVNVPLIEDKLAVRAVAYQFDNSGYIDNVVEDNLTPALNGGIALGGIADNQDDIGNEQFRGLRLTTLWQATDNLQLTLAYTQQEIEQDGLPQVDTNLPQKYQQAKLRTGLGGRSTESTNSDINITNLVLNYTLDWGNITASSSWIDYEAPSEFDLTFAAGFPFSSTNDFDADVVTGELRFASEFDGPLQVLAGAYYEDRETESISDQDWSGDPALEADFAINFLGVPSGDAKSLSDVDETVEQLAFFGELSYQISDNFNATVGIRHFDYDQAFVRTVRSFFGDVDEGNKNTEDGQNYKVNLSYTPQEDTLIYGQWAEGFRLGSPQTPLTAVCDANGDGQVDLGGGEELSVPDSVAPDELESFELGLKTRLPNSNTTLSATVYRINWEGIPVSITAPCFFSFTLNAGESKSEGVELELQTQLNDNLRLDFSASYGEATLTADAPSLGSKGDNLPGSADYNVTLGLEYYFTFAGYSAFSRADYSYIDEYFHNIAETGEASGGYGQLNVKTGISIDNVDIDLFVNNLTNADDFTWVETGFSVGRAYRLRPRTVGLNLGYQF